MSTGPAPEPDYRALASFRRALREFSSFSEAAARQVGLAPARHQALLAIKGHPASPPSVGELAAFLGLRHHSAVGVVDRLVKAGLARRASDPADKRVVRVRLSANGERLLARLSGQHQAELRRRAPGLRALLSQLEAGPGGGPAAA